MIIGLILEGPSAPLVAQLGGVLQLPCSVDTPIPLQDLNVEWRRTDSKEVVHLFQGEESRPELQSSTYRGRAFFTQSEMAKGNYSLVLRNITTDDAGSFTCRVYTKEQNGEIEVYIETIGEQYVSFKFDVNTWIYSLFYHISCRGWILISKE